MSAAGRRTSLLRKRRLIELLSPGGKCMDPECSGRSQEMHINHVDGRDWEPRDFDMSRRVARYWREYESGVRLSVLCKECNSMSRNRPGYVPEEPVF